jgi:hypothetical protein
MDPRKPDSRMFEEIGSDQDILVTTYAGLRDELGLPPDVTLLSLRNEDIDGLKTDPAFDLDITVLFSLPKDPTALTNESSPWRKFLLRFQRHDGAILRLPVVRLRATLRNTGIIRGAQLMDATEVFTRGQDLHLRVDETAHVETYGDTYLLPATQPGTPVYGEIVLHPDGAEHWSAHNLREKKENLDRRAAWRGLKLLMDTVNNAGRHGVPEDADDAARLAADISDCLHRCYGKGPYPSQVNFAADHGAELGIQTSRTGFDGFLSRMKAYGYTWRDLKQKARESE